MATEGSIASIFIVQVEKAPVARLRILAMVSSFLSGMRPSPAAWLWAVSFVVVCRMASETLLAMPTAWPRTVPSTVRYRLR